MLASPLFLLAAAGTSNEPSALGFWTANGARLELKEEQGKVVGRLAAEGGPCPVPAGTELLKGTLLDDSISAQVRLCLVTPKCASSADSALAVLLVTKTLTGGVHTTAACAAGAVALVLRRPGPAVALLAPAPNERLSRAAPRPARKGATDDIASPGLLPVPATDRPARPAAYVAGYDARDARGTGVHRLLVDGKVQLDAGRFERARDLFRAALERDPQRAEAYNGVGVTFHARGDLDEALAWYKRGLEADPRFGDSFYNMACVYALQNHTDLAFRYLRLAALNGTSGREQLQRDPDLGSLRDDPQWTELLDQASVQAKPSHP